MRYQVAFQDPQLIDANAARSKIALYNNIIPPITSLNILCPRFQVLPVSGNSWFLEPFAIIPLHLDLNKAKVTATKLVVFVVSPCLHGLTFLC